MAFSVEARVKVSDQSSDYRNKFGTVIAAAAGVNTVRIDGYPASQGVRLLDAQLKTSTQEDDITYGDE